MATKKGATELEANLNRAVVTGELDHDDAARMLTEGTVSTKRNRRTGLRWGETHLEGDTLITYGSDGYPEFH